jgi:hypothetical protein
MRDRVVAGQHDVEVTGDRGELPETGHTERNVSAQSRCLDARTRDGTLADVGAVHPVTAERQPDRLGPDSARAVERVACVRASGSDQTVERRSLVRDGVVHLSPYTR